MLTYCFIITTKQYGYLFSRKPYHIILQADIYLSLSILCLIDNYLILFVYICLFHIVKRLLILSCCMCHAYPLLPSMALLRVSHTA